VSKLKNIQALRGIAVLFVVMFHLFIVEKRYSGLNSILPESIQFGTFGVDLFFAISGFVMVTVTRGKFKKTREAFIFLYNRMTRIYPLYWIYSILALIVFLIQPSWVNSSQGNQVNLLASFLLLPSDKLPLVQVGWTLIHEVYFYIVYFLIFLLLPEHLLYYALGGWGLCVVIFSLLIPAGNPYFDLIFSPLTVEFLGGCGLAILYYKEKAGSTQGWVLALIAGIALLMSLRGHETYRAATGWVAPLGWWRILIYGIPALTITYCLIHAEQTGFVIHPFFSRLGDASYSIYLSHLFTINVAGRIWALFATDQWMNHLTFLSLTFFLVLAVGFASHDLVETNLLKLSRKFIRS